MNAAPDPSLQAQRHRTLAQQLRSYEVLDERVLSVLEDMPREHFTPARFRRLAYAETCVPLDHGQCMLTPTLDGRILQALEVAPHERILDVGTGSGYLAACLARLGDQVTSVDIFPDLVDAAQSRLDALGIVNCELHAADIFSGQPGSFDVIAVTGSVPVREPRFEQWLEPGGRLFVAAGSGPMTEAWLVRRHGEDQWSRRRLFETLIPPLLHAPQPSAFEF